MPKGYKFCLLKNEFGDVKGTLPVPCIRYFYRRTSQLSMLNVYVLSALLLISIVDSQIAKLKNIDVQEMTNGCLCCVLVGQMKEGLLELKAKYNPDRIIIETSGSAFPGKYYHPLAKPIQSVQQGTMY